MRSKAHFLLPTMPKPSLTNMPSSAADPNPCSSSNPRSLLQRAAVDTHPALPALTICRTLTNELARIASDLCAKQNYNMAAVVFNYSRAEQSIA